MSGAPPPPPPPHLTGKVIGFREWGLKGYRLMSGAGEWAIGPNTAECRRDIFEVAVSGMPWRAQHEAPEHHCTCGLYAWYEPNVWAFGAGGYERSVYGVVTAWGHIEAQPTGFRSQYAEPVVLAYHAEQPYRQVMDLKAIAQEMRLPCVPIEELEAEAARHGQRIPPELRPDDPRGVALPPSALALASRGRMMGASTGSGPVATAFMPGGYMTPPPPRRRPP